MSMYFGLCCMDRDTSKRNDNNTYEKINANTEVVKIVFQVQRYSNELLHT